MRRERIGEGAKVMGMVGVPENLVTAKHSRFEDDQGLVLYGPPGRGKSWLAAGLVRRRLWALARTASTEVREWWLAEGGVRFVRVERLMQMLRKDAFDGEASEADAVERWGRVGYLVLDDLGAEKRSEWVGQTLHSLLSHREAGGLTTVITTNYDSVDLEEMYAGWGGPIVSRLCALCTWLLVEGEDRRRG